MLCRAKQAKGRLSGSHVEVTLENATPTSLDPSLRLMRLMGTTKSCVRGDFMGSPLGESGDGALGLSRAYSTRAEEMARRSGGDGARWAWYFCSTSGVLFVAVIFCRTKRFLT